MENKNKNKEQAMGLIK